jgi:hypothetical protein
MKWRVKLITEDVESRRNLCRGTIPFETICSRLKRRNLSGKTWQRTSPIETVEPLLVQHCRKLANIGSPLCKDQVISLVASLICNTVHYDSLVEFKKRLRLQIPIVDDDSCGESSFLGRRWYEGFLLRNNDKIMRGKGRVKDIKRHTWCTYENFVDMYDGVYKAMVLAKVAVELDEERMYDMNGEEVNLREQCFGRPTRYEVTRPEQIVFVDKTGCNTS